MKPAGFWIEPQPVCDRVASLPATCIVVEGYAYRRLNDCITANLENGDVVTPKAWVAGPESQFITAEEWLKRNDARRLAFAVRVRKAMNQWLVDRLKLGDVAARRELEILHKSGGPK